MKHNIRFQRPPKSAKATIMSTVRGWDIERCLFELLGKGTRRVGIEECKLLSDVVGAYVEGESIGTGCAGLKVCAGRSEGEKAKPGGFEDW